MNSMKEIRIEKLTLNCGVGEAGDKLNKAMELLKKITGKQPVKTITMKRIPTWDIRPNLPIGCKVTLRHKEAEELLKRLLQAVDNKIPVSKFDKNGSFSFGIEEYLLIPGVEYDINIGIIGLDVAVTLERPGYRIKRKIKKSKIGAKHRISKEEAIEFMRKNFNIMEIE